MLTSNSGQFKLVCWFVPVIIWLLTSQASSLRDELAPVPSRAAGTGHLRHQNVSIVAASGEQGQGSLPELQDKQVQQSLKLGGRCALKSSCSREPLDDKPACYCDQKCATYDDCCQDSRWAEQLARRVELGSSKLRDRRQQWHCKRINPIYGDVLVRARCDPAWLQAQVDKTQAELTRRRCEFGASIGDSQETRSPTSDASDWVQADPLGSMMPITDLMTGVTYANSYCLRCNTMQNPKQQAQQRQEQLVIAQQKPRVAAGGAAAPKRPAARLVFWSPLVKCNYNLDSDDSDTLFDLISSKKGQALKYSHKRRRWHIKMQAPASNATTTTGRQLNSTRLGPASGPSEEKDEETAPAGSERVCTIMPTVPDSVEHLVRHCRLNTIDSCPASSHGANFSADQQVAGRNRDELQRAHFECKFGHQALVYSLDTKLVYYNLACAKCNNERNVHCEPLGPKKHFGHYSRVTTGSHGHRNQSDARASQQHQQQQQQNKTGQPTIYGYPPAPLEETVLLPGDTPGQDQSEDEIAASARSRTSSSQAGATSGSFSVLMDLYGGFRGGADHWDQLVGSAHQCEDAQQQVYDPFLLTCRDIICGLNHRFVDGSCVLVEQQQQQQQQHQQQAGSSNGRQDDWNLFADPSSGGHDERQQTARDEQRQSGQAESLALVGSNKQERVEVARSEATGTSGGQSGAGGVDSTADKHSSSSGGASLSSEQPNGGSVHEAAVLVKQTALAQAQQQQQAVSGVSSTVGAPDSGGDNAHNHRHKQSAETGQEPTSTTTAASLTTGVAGGRLVFAADRRAETSAKLSQLDSGAPNRTEAASIIMVAGSGMSGGQQDMRKVPVAAALQPVSLSASDSDSNYLSVGDVLSRLNLDELPLASAESRRLFAKCAKIFIKPEHYRLFTIADLINYKSSLSSSASASANASESGAPSSSELRDPNANENTPRLHSTTATASTTTTTAKPSQHQQATNHLGDVYAFVAPYNLTLASSQFELVHSFAVVGQHQQQSAGSDAAQADDSDQFNLLVCSPFKTDLADKFKPTMVYLTTGCLVVSIASLACYLLLYCLATFDLRHMVVELCQAHQMGGAGGWLNKKSMNLDCRGSRASNETSYNAARSQSLSSRGVACLAAALLAAYMLFILGHHQQEQQQQQQHAHRHQSELAGANEQPMASEHNETGGTSSGQDLHAAEALSSCELIAAGTYCFFLLAFNWMFLLSYDIWRALRLATYQFRAPAMGSQSRRFLVYAALAISSATAIAALALALDHMSPPSSPACQKPVGKGVAPGLHQTSCPAAEDGFLLELQRLAQLYRPKFGQRAGSCWFSNRRSLAIFFGLPVTLVSLVNLVFFFHISFMVIRTSSDSATSSSSSFTSTSSKSTTLTPTCKRAPLGTTFLKHHEHAAGAEPQVDFAQQNSLTTSSLSSVRTIQSNISLESASSQLPDRTFPSDSSENSHDQDEDDEAGEGGEDLVTGRGVKAFDPRDGATARKMGSPPSRASTIAYFDTANTVHQPEGAASCESEGRRQLQQSQQTELHRQMKLLAESELSRESLCNDRFAADMMSSSSLISSSNQSTCQLNSSLGSNLAQKYDQQKKNLTLFMSSIAKDYRLYCRLSTIMGLTWLTGLLASLVDQSDALWYLFVLLNTLQGLFIFIAFGFKRSRLANLEILLKYLAYKLASSMRTKTKKTGQKQDARVASSFEKTNSDSAD